MTPVSRIKLSPEIENRIISTFISEVAKITEPEKVRSFITLLLSDSEKLMLAKRLVAFVMIDQRVPDARIANTLHLTRITVAKLRLTYALSKERRADVVRIIQNPRLSEILKPLFKQFLDYALPAAMGRIPHPKHKI